MDTLLRICDHFIPSIFVKNIFTILSCGRVRACSCLQRSEKSASLELELLTSVCELSGVSGRN